MASFDGMDKSAPLLVTGAAGFVGKNLTAELRARGYENLLLYDIDTPQQALEQYAAQARFVFHLAGVNRPKNADEFYSGNAGLTQQLLGLLAQAGNTAPLLVTSSVQAGNGTDYGNSKLQAEQAVFDHAAATGAPVYVYRLAGLFGKWSRPAYNSVVATFCHNIAHGLPIEVRDATYEFPLCYIDDVVASFIAALEGALPPPPAGKFCTVQPEYFITLGKLAELLQGYHESRLDLTVPNMSNAFEKKLYATYLSYLPTDAFAYDLLMNTDDRGSFTEFLRTPERGQVSVNVAKPGVVKGNHWHHTKNEKFLVVNGHGVIRFRKLGGDEVIEYPVSGERLRVVDIPPGYTHNIENTGDEDLVTVMWVNEAFDPENPDTYFERV